MLEGLIGALIGAFVAAFATVIVAKWQLKLVSKNHFQSTDQLNRLHGESLDLVSKNHREALDEQNKIIQETFAHQLLLQANERKIQHQLEFLSRIERLAGEDAWDVYLKGHQLRNGGPEGLDPDKAFELSVEVKAFQDEVSRLSIRFCKFLDESAHFEEFNMVFRQAMSFQNTFYNLGGDLILTLKDYPKNPNAQITGFVRDKFLGFSAAVNLFEEWIAGCREKARDFRSRIYAGEVIR